MTRRFRANDPQSKGNNIRGFKVSQSTSLPVRQCIAIVDGSRQLAYWLTGKPAHWYHRVASEISI
jgi:hypothetical protein